LVLGLEPVISSRQLARKLVNCCLNNVSLQAEVVEEPQRVPRAELICEEDELAVMALIAVLTDDKQDCIDESWSMLERNFEHPEETDWVGMGAAVAAAAGGAQAELELAEELDLAETEIATRESNAKVFIVGRFKRLF